MERSPNFFLKDISIGSQPQPVTWLPVRPLQKVTGDSTGTRMSLTVPLAAVENVENVSPCASASIRVVYSEKVFFSFVLAEQKEHYPRLPRVLELCFRKGCFTTVGQHTTAQLTLFCSSGAGLHFCIELLSAANPLISTATTFEWEFCLMEILQLISEQGFFGLSYQAMHGRQCHFFLLFFS